jgi:heparosan-N-sulfate-glucuronate 5-epimerase
MRDILGKYWIDLAPRKVPHRGPVDDLGIPLHFLSRHPRGAGPIYHPVVIMQYALGNFDLALKGDAVAQDAFIRCAHWVQDNAVEERGGRFLVWPYSYPLRTPPVRPPWISGMAQGEALSVLVREFLRTGSGQTADVAQRAAKSFLYTVSDGGVITPTGNNSVFVEEYACLPSIHVLNGCLTGLFGLFEYLQVFPDSRLETIFEAGLHGAEKWLPDFDMGFWSRYSLGVRWHIATVHYHNLHIKQLRYFGRTFGRPAFSDRADRWEAYTRRAVNRWLHRRAEFLSLNGNRAMTVLSLNSLKYRKS